MMMTGFGLGFSAYVWMIIFWIAVIGIGIWLLAALFPRIGTTSDRSASSGDPLTILKQRYAHGELSKEEFQAMRHDLEHMQL